MRPRSSKFVMLLLLVCSVQVGEAYALRIIAGQTLHQAALRNAPAATSRRVQPAAAEASRPALALSESASVVVRIPWAMSHPASASTAVASFTGLRRA